MLHLESQSVPSDLVVLVDSVFCVDHRLGNFRFSDRFDIQDLSRVGAVGVDRNSYRSCYTFLGLSQRWWVAITIVVGTWLTLRWRLCRRLLSADNTAGKQPSGRVDTGADDLLLYCIGATSLDAFATT